MRQVLSTVFSVMLGAAIMVAVSAQSAFAAGSDIGQNVGKLLGTWAQALYIGIAALVALKFLLNRQFSELVVFMLAAVLVGVFVLAPNDASAAIRDIAHAILR